MFTQPQHLACSFTTFFSFSVMNLNPSSIGGGLTFVLAPDSDSIGAAGRFLGLIGGDVAVHFDTLMDVEFKDINGNHVGLDLNSVVSDQVGDLGILDIDLKSGNMVNSWIKYDSSSQIFIVSVSYSNLKPKDPILSLNLDLGQYVNEFMFVGFSGSTQGSTEVHSIEWWSFSSAFESNLGSTEPPPPTTSLTNPSANIIKAPPPSLAPSSSNSTANTQLKSSKSSSCHNQLCKQGPGAVAGVVTAGAFVFAIFAPIIRDQPLAVIGSGDSAMEESTYLTKYGSKVYIIHRRDSSQPKGTLEGLKMKNSATG